jgi:DNA-binding MarR family transcriptional regulator
VAAIDKTRLLFNKAKYPEPEKKSEPMKTPRPETALALVLHVFRLANVLGQVGNRLAGTYGLTAQQWLALTSIGIGGEHGVTPTEIGKNALVSPQNVTGLLDRLERAGYIQRTQNGNDRRSFRVRLTEAGAQVFQALNPLGATWARQAAAALPREAVETFRKLLEQYLDAVTKAAFVNGRPGRSLLTFHQKKFASPTKTRQTTKAFGNASRARSQAAR